MRRLLRVLAASILSVGVLVPPSGAAPACPNPADQSVYEVLSLRQQMVVIATKCNRVQEYDNNFVKRFQPVLQANDRAALAYFRRVYGGAGQGRMDTFTTTLVNVLSRQANTEGGEYCPRAGLIIAELNALRSMDELVAYAAVKDLAPVGTSMCPPGSRR